MQDAASSHGLHNSTTAAARDINSPDRPSPAPASQRFHLASRRHSNGHGSRSSRDHMQRQRERSQERSHHSSSRDGSLSHRGKQSTGRGRRADSPYSPSRAARRPRQRSDSRDGLPGEGGSGSQVASILQLLSTVTLQSIRKCVAGPMPLSNLTAAHAKPPCPSANATLYLQPRVSRQGLTARVAEYVMHSGGGAQRPQSCLDLPNECIAYPPAEPLHHIPDLLSEGPTKIMSRAHCPTDLTNARSPS